MNNGETAEDMYQYPNRLVSYISDNIDVAILEQLLFDIFVLYVALSLAYLNKR